MSKKMITLMSSEGECFEVEEAVARQSETIAHLIEDDCVEDGVPLANVKAKILAKVIEFCKKHAVEGGAETSSVAAKKQELKKFDDEFIQVDQTTLFELMLAANYLNIKELLDLSCQTVADSMKSKTVEEIRTMFGIESDFTKEEEEAMRGQNQWAFE